MLSQLNPSQTNGQVNEDILGNIRIPPCPEVVLVLVEAARQPDADFAKLVKLISGDVGLAAAMLKTANSPFFAMRNKVSSVHQAVLVLGLKNLTQIVRGLALQEALGAGKVSMERFWERANFTAVAASRMATRLGTVSSEDAYTLGLFHDCGIPILIQKFPDYKEKLAASNKFAELVIVIEDQHYTINHAVVGNTLARNWSLPDHINQAILLHHDHSIFTQPSESIAPEVCALVAITLVAEHIAATFLGKPDDAEWNVCGQMAQDYLGIDSKDIEDIIKLTFDEMEEILTYR